MYDCFVFWQASDAMTSFINAAGRKSLHALESLQVNKEFGEAQEPGAGPANKMGSLQAPLVVDLSTRQEQDLVVGDV